MAMRTSGASHNDSLLVLMTIGIAGAIIVMLLGGPREVIFEVERMTRNALTALVGLLR